MTKRERLKIRLAEKEKTLQLIQQSKECDCKCHEPGSEILHVMSCCIRYVIDVHTLESEIAALKIKLRK